MPQSRVSRRSPRAGSVAIGSNPAVGAGAAGAKSISGKISWGLGVANAPESAPPDGHRFFSPDEAVFIDTAVSWLIPNDDLGQGVSARVSRKLAPRNVHRSPACPFGTAQSRYMTWALGQRYRLPKLPVEACACRHLACQSQEAS